MTEAYRNVQKVEDLPSKVEDPRFSVEQSKALKEAGFQIVTLTPQNLYAIWHPPHILSIHWGGVFYPDMLNQESSLSGDVAYRAVDTLKAPVTGTPEAQESLVTKYTTDLGIDGVTGKIGTLLDYLAIEKSYAYTTNPSSTIFNGEPKPTLQTTTLLKSTRDYKQHPAVMSRLPTRVSMDVIAKKPMILPLIVPQASRL